jgi:eukaryotic-like serine/threonine-protein kinase
METRGMFGGRYRVIAPVGAGGMATVYRARDHWRGREVAVKLIAAQRRQDTMTLRRFRREAEIAARLEHPNIVRVLDAGRHPDEFIVMELIEGVDAAKLVKRSGRLSLRHTLRIVGPVCDALEHAHREGVIHGDVSASNIMVRKRDGIPKLGDFGLASELGTPPDEHPGKITGTPGYVAPELLEGALPSPRSDLYSMAAVTHHLLTATSGFAPAPARTTEPAPAAVLRLPHLRDERGDLPRAVIEAVGQALSSDPDERQASVADFRAQLIREAAVPFSLPDAA